MAPSANLADPRLDRSMRRLGCLVRLDAAHRAAQRRRRARTTELEVLMRRAERAPR
jgi:hypothetical protein